MRYVAVAILVFALANNDLAWGCTTSTPSSNSDSARSGTDGGSSSSSSSSSSSISFNKTCGYSAGFTPGFHGEREGGPNKNDIVPWLVMVVYNNQSCPGYIIKDKWVLTQASCANSSTTSVVVLAGTNRTAIGNHRDEDSHHRRGWGYGPRQSNSQPQCPPPRVNITSSGIFVHPNYTTSTLAYNIALIKLNGAFVFNDTDIQPICIPENITLCQQLCATNSSRPRRDGYRHGFKGCGAGGSTWSQQTVTFNATINQCIGASDASDIFGASPVTVPGSSGGQNVCLLPNDRNGKLYTVACCIGQWVALIITANS